MLSNLSFNQVEMRIQLVIADPLQVYLAVVLVGLNSCCFNYLFCCEDAYDLDLHMTAEVCTVVFFFV